MLNYARRVHYAKLRRCFGYWLSPIMPGKRANMLASDARQNAPKCSQNATYKCTYIYGPYTNLHRRAMEVELSGLEFRTGTILEFRTGTVPLGTSTCSTCTVQFVPVAVREPCRCQSCEFPSRGYTLTTNSTNNVGEELSILLLDCILGPQRYIQIQTFP